MPPCVWASSKSKALWGLYAAERIVSREAGLFPDPLALAPGLDKVVSFPRTGRACLKRKLGSGFQERKGVTAVPTDLRVYVLCVSALTPAYSVLYS